MQSDVNKVDRSVTWINSSEMNEIKPMQRDVRLVEVTDEELGMLRKVRLHTGHPEFLRFLIKIEDTPSMKCSDGKCAIPKCVVGDVSLLPWNGGVGVAGAYLKPIETFLAATESGEPLQHYAKIFISILLISILLIAFAGLCRVGVSLYHPASAPATPASIDAVALSGDITRTGTLGGSNAVLSTYYMTLDQGLSFLGGGSVWYTRGGIDPTVTWARATSTGIPTTSWTDILANATAGMYYAFNGCSGLTGPIPILSKMKLCNETE